MCTHTHTFILLMRNLQRERYRCMQKWCGPAVPGGEREGNETTALSEPEPDLRTHTFSSSSLITMATFNPSDRLCIQVPEHSAESGLFLVHVACNDLILLEFWWRKDPFQSELLEQTSVVRTTRPSRSLGLEFVLRARHRAPGVGNAHYWSPFVLGLCLDAVRFGFVLPLRARIGGFEDEMQETGQLVLQRMIQSLFHATLTVPPIAEKLVQM
ncbi:uncharacterized protein LOC143518250 [Brachyhypopomus gauderio]|uniref:uncharacterized protein LOC143518250 n=1 Tax=Brachyhypopomus gauderio TaxID=698409 RepID=UPI0040439086